MRLAAVLILCLLLAAGCAQDEPSAGSLADTLDDLAKGADAPADAREKAFAAVDQVDPGGWKAPSDEDEPPRP